MKSFKDGMTAPTIVLVAICLVISGALAFTYQLTLPQIEKINKETADAARMEVLEGASAFTAYEGELPEGITEYYIEDGGAGVVATAQNKSFGGTMNVMVGMDASGAITGVKVTKHADTAGLGTKAHDPVYLECYKGVTELDNGDNVKKDTKVSFITGATVSSNGVHGAVYKALGAYGEIGMGGDK